MFPRFAHARMKARRFKIRHLLVVVLIVAFVLASVVEQGVVIARSSTRSPDGNWSLKLELVEHSTVFSSRKMLHASVNHSTNSEWHVSTSIPFDDANAAFISDQDRHHPVSWSEDSSSETYWIHDELQDCMTIKASSEQFVFKRNLYSLTVTHGATSDGG